MPFVECLLLVVVVIVDFGEGVADFVVEVGVLCDVEVGLVWVVAFAPALWLVVGLWWAVVL